MFLENQPNQQGQGWIEVICGSMFSGKTEELIRRLKRAEFAQQEVQVFKPAIDERYSNAEVVSHNSNSFSSISVKSSTELLDLSDGVEVVGIDEAQFFDHELPAVCNLLANRGIRVVVAGLDMDYKGRPFGPMPHLLAIAEFVTKVHAICVKTGTLANHSFRLGEEDDLVQLGEQEEYIPLSRTAFTEAMHAREEKDTALENMDINAPLNKKRQAELASFREKHFVDDSNV